jgi:hypothetical protein
MFSKIKVEYRLAVLEEEVTDLKQEIVDLKQKISIDLLQTGWINWLVPSQMKLHFSKP